MATIGKWLHSHDEETFGCLEEFDSRQQAIECFAECGCDTDPEPGAAFWTGRISPPATGLDADALISIMRDAAYEECGDAVGDWLSGPALEDVADLGKKINAVWYAWLKQIGETPEFFSIQQVKKHALPMAKGA